MPDSITSFEVYRSATSENGPWGSPIATLPGTARSYADSANPSPRFWYKLIGHTAEGHEIPYNIVSIGPNTWAKNFGGTSYNYGQAVAVGPDGNIVFVSAMAGSADYGNGTLSSAGALDLVLAKYSPSGTCLWAYRFGASGFEQPKAVKTDSNGNIFVATYFNGTGNVGNGTGGGNLTSVGDGDILLSKYSPDGTNLWVKQFGGTGDDKVNGMVVTANGDVIITGSFTKGINFGGGMFGTAFDGENIFVAKLSGVDGSHMWSKGWQARGFSSGTGIALDSDNNLFVSGFHISGYTDFEAPVGRLTCPNVTPAIMVLKLNVATGAPMAGRLFGGTTTQRGDRGSGVAILNNKPVFIGTFQTPSVDFGNGHVLTNFWEKDQMFIVGLSSDLSTCLWSSQSFNPRGEQFQTAASIAVDSNNRIVVIGNFQYEIVIGGTRLVSTTGLGNIYLYVAYFNSSGGFISANQLGGTVTSVNMGFNFASAAGTNFYLTGYFGGGTVNFYGTSLTSHSNYDAFLVKI